MNLVLALLGPTASGKSAFALEVAQRLNGEIISLDSTTIYKGFDVGSSKPSQDDRAKIPHHLVDILDPNEPFSAGHFVAQANAVIEDILKRKKMPLVVGGTYFYLRALQHGMYPTPAIASEIVEEIETEYFEEDVINTTKMHAHLKAKDPEAANAIHPNDRYRLVRALAILRTSGELPSRLKPEPLAPSQTNRLWLKYALAISRHTLSANIVKRTDSMLNHGLVEETRRCRAANPKARALSSIGYAEAGSFLDKKITDKQLRNEIIEKTRQLAKRQITWLRSDTEVRYVDSRDLDRIELEVQNLTVALG